MKKTIAALLAVIMVFTVLACGCKKEAETPTEAEETTESIYKPYEPSQDTEEPTVYDIPSVLTEKYPVADFDALKDTERDADNSKNLYRISGTLEEVTEEYIDAASTNMFYGSVKDDNGYTFRISLDMEDYLGYHTDKETMTALIGHPLVFVCEYQGWSQTNDKPVFNTLFIFDRTTGETIEMNWKMASEPAA